MRTVDPSRSAGLESREIRTGSRDGKPTKIALARRWYAAGRIDVWDALTNPERIPRWFMPVSGDLAVGGRYQFEGNAGGLVEDCQEPKSFAVTWEFGGEISWVQVQLSEVDSGTMLELAHEAHVDPDLWAQFGPGAVGVGWDLALHGIGEHLAGGAPVDPASAATWPTSSAGAQFVRLASDGWAEAAIGDGDDPEEARAAAGRTAAFYTTPPEATPQV